MADIIKEAFNIKVNHMVQMLYLYQSHALRNSSLSGTVRAEPVGVLTEFASHIGSMTCKYIAVRSDLR